MPKPKPKAGGSRWFPTTLNEAAHLTTTLKAVLEGGPEQVIVVDGGSQDHTVELAHASGVQVITAPRGRGRQLNAGAKAASAAQLLFLHADTLPPVGYRELVGRTLADPKTAACQSSSWRRDTPHRNAGFDRLQVHVGKVQMSLETGGWILVPPSIQVELARTCAVAWFVAS